MWVTPASTLQRAYRLHLHLLLLLEEFRGTTDWIHLFSKGVSGLDVLGELVLLLHTIFSSVSCSTQGDALL